MAYLNIEGQKKTEVLQLEEDVDVKYWLPVLFGLHGIIMTTELDIRTK